MLVQQLLVLSLGDGILLFGSSLAGDEAGTEADWHNNQMVLGGGSSFNLSNVVTESHLTKGTKATGSE